MISGPRGDLEKIRKAGVKIILGIRVRVGSNFWLEVEPNDKAFTPNIVECGYWEAWVSVAISNELHNQGNETLFIDAGANVGYYSMLAAAGGYDVKAFEPIPDLADMIRRTAKFNNFKSIEVWPFALSDKVGKFSLSLNLEHSGSSSLNISDSENKIDVDVEELDHLVVEEDRNIVLKVDVEGQERQVWNGARHLREDNNTTWFIEWVPERESYNYNFEWLGEVHLTHDIHVVRLDGKTEPIEIEDALKLKFETLCFRQRG